MVNLNHIILLLDIYHLLIHFIFKLLQVIWQPYIDDVLSSLPEYCRIGQELWHSVMPLICFQIVEWHLPNCALRQFGIQQDIPQPTNTDVKLHDCDLRGKVHENWRQRWRNYISKWDHRREHVVTRDKRLVSWHIMIHIWIGTIGLLDALSVAGTAVMR